MGRKRKGQALQDKIDMYLREYELDELNQANDMAALSQMCQLEINMEQINEALTTIKDPVFDSKKIKDLMSSLRDSTQSWTALQAELGIARKKRQVESDESPLQYVDRLKSQAKKFLENRFTTLECPNCFSVNQDGTENHLVLGKYYFYIGAEGEGGSIESKKTTIREHKYTVRHECWKCGKVVGVSNEDLVVA